MIHPFADVQSVNIGDGTTVWQYSIILSGAVIGKRCNINCNVFIENNVVIGDEVTIKPGVQIWDGITIGNKVFIGPNVTFTNDLYPRSKQYLIKHLATTIEDGVSIGANSTIIAGITIHKYAMIGAGSVVTKPIPPFTLWYGNPATQQGYITKDGVVLNDELVGMNGRKYQLINNEPVII